MLLTKKITISSGRAVIVVMAASMVRVIADGCGLLACGLNDAHVDGFIRRQTRRGHLDAVYLWEERSSELR